MEPTQAIEATTAQVATEVAEAPGEVLVHLRWRSPLQTFAAVREMVGPTALPLDEALESAVAAFGDEDGVDPERLWEAFAADAPIDVVVVALPDDPEPVVVSSVGFRSIPAALNAFEAPVRLGDGTWRLYGADDETSEPPSEGDADGDPLDEELYDDPAPSVCLLAAATGPASARIICGPDEAKVARLVPFVARRLAAKPSAAEDLHLKFSFGRNRARFARDLRDAWPEAREEITEEAFGDAALAAVLRRVGDAAVEELADIFSELDHTTVTADVGPEGLTFGFEVGLSGQRSRFAQGLADWAAHGGPPRELLARLPVETTTAQYGVSLADEHLAPMLTAGRDVAAALLNAEKVGTPADRNAWLALLRTTVHSHAGHVFATGVFPATGVGPKVGTREWWLSGIEAPAGPVVTWLKDATRAYNRPAVRQLIRDAFDAEVARNLPRARLLPVRPPWAARLRVDLPPGLTKPSPPPIPVAPLATPTGPVIVDHYELRVLGDGNRTWIGVASDDNALRAMMLRLAQAPSSPSGLAAVLSQRQATSASATTVAGLLDEYAAYVTIIATAAGTPNPSWWSASALPHGGTAPILTLIDAAPQPSLRVRYQIPRPALE
ncbi:MAG: hypothetical protein AAF715_32070, partial [Myxococcota bacterium]